VVNSCIGVAFGDTKGANTPSTFFLPKYFSGCGVEEGQITNINIF
jgi:hypothetical protein